MLAQNHVLYCTGILGKSWQIVANHSNLGGLQWSINPSWHIMTHHDTSWHIMNHDDSCLHPQGLFLQDAHWSLCCVHRRRDSQRCGGAGICHSHPFTKWRTVLKDLARFKVHSCADLIHVSWPAVLWLRFQMLLCVLYLTTPETVNGCKWEMWTIDIAITNSASCSHVALSCDSSCLSNSAWP